MNQPQQPPRYALVGQEYTAYGETAGEIIAHLIPGYDQIPETEAGNEQALVARWERAVATANRHQGVIAANAANAGVFDPATETEDTLTTMLSDRRFPVTDVTEWTHPVPLCLITTDYAPCTDRTRTSGNILWFDTSDELSYLRSLTAHGLIDLLVHDH